MSDGLVRAKKLKSQCWYSKVTSEYWPRAGETDWVRCRAIDVFAWLAGLVSVQYLSIASKSSGARLEHHMNLFEHKHKAQELVSDGIRIFGFPSPVVDCFENPFTGAVLSCNRIHLILKDLP